MTRQVLVVPPELTLEGAWKLMRRRHIRHLPVVSAGVLVGILSDRDVLVRGTLMDDDSMVLPALPVAAAMTLNPLTCDRSTSISTLASLMIERKLDAVPVVSSTDRLVGLVTSSDLLALLVTGNSAKVIPFEFELRDWEQDEALAG